MKVEYTVYSTTTQQQHNNNTTKQQPKHSTLQDTQNQKIEQEMAANRS